jgi:hypothetical protein
LFYDLIEAGGSMPAARTDAFSVRGSIFVLTTIGIVSIAVAQRQSRTVTANANGLAAWEQVYSVLTHPRCLNCHTATNYPQQGDNRARHFANVIRGPGGTGVAAFRCVTCHQKENADSTGVPGGPNWHLAPLSMKWQDRNDQPLSSGEVCRAVTDRSRNENMDGPALLKHHTEAELVLWAWAPGKRPDGSMRTLPPLTHEQFVTATMSWVKAGMPCPPK